MKPEPDEKALVAEVLLKNRTAFERLIRQYEGLVIHIVVPLIKNPADREDICQDVFLKVYEKLHTFQFRSKLSTWIGSIAFNTAINFLKKKRNKLLEDVFKSYNENDSAAYEKYISRDKTQNPENLLIQKEEMKRLKTAVARLSGIQRTILLLFHQDELSLEEISLIVEMPVNTVKSHLFRARTGLKEMLLHNKK
jgi:RNA polymerase sigma-70 factor (ECF subfamily)